MRHIKSVLLLLIRCDDLVVFISDRKKDLFLGDLLLILRLLMLFFLGQYFFGLQYLI